MIFSNRGEVSLYDLVLSGRKTQTRRPCKEGDEVYMDDKLQPASTLSDGQQVLSVYRAGRLKWRFGKWYAVQPGRGKPSGGLIHLSGIAYIAQAGSISHPDALAEGFASVEAFQAAWVAIYGEEALTLPCWRLSWLPKKYRQKG